MVNTEQAVMTGLVLANAVELIAGVIGEIAGEEISTHLSGEEIFGSVLSDTIAVKLQSTLIPHLV
jgi:hypothetical protein